MSSDRLSSHGRGGAGNMLKDDPSSPSSPLATDLITPTLKSETYTTGRGGTGNMAHNDPARPELARAAQDVESPAPRPSDMAGPQHYGRGGAANVTDATTATTAHATETHDDEKALDGAGAAGGTTGKGLLNKGKEMLNKLGKK